MQQSVDRIVEPEKIMKVLSDRRSIHIEGKAYKKERFRPAMLYGAVRRNVRNLK